MTDEQLLRYARHLLLDDIGLVGQERLLAARALVIGAGGLGSPVAMYLGASGVGHITLVDPDQVDLTNLQRQIAHTTDRVGHAKVESARASIAALNPGVQVHTHCQSADEALLDELVPRATVVLDCTDNFAARQAVNAACVRHATPLVWGAAIRMDGQLSVYEPSDPSSPCYACLFAPETRPEESACATMGVFAPLVGIIGSMQAAEALKILASAGRSLSGRLLLLDGRSMEWSELRAARDPHCSVCGTRG